MCHAGRPRDGCPAIVREGLAARHRRTQRARASSTALAEHALHPRAIMVRLTWPLLFALPLVALPGLAPTRARPSPDTRPLPAPTLLGGAPVWTVIAARRSRRAFGDRALTDAELAQLLWAAQGLDDGHRTAPSAGALYPLTVRVVDARGVWRYAPAQHALVAEQPRDRRAALADAALRQQAVRTAPLTLVITGELAITAATYGTRGADRFVALEAGHVAQNVLLAATALGLAAVPVGAFDEAALPTALALPTGATPLYLIPVGPLP